MDIFTQAYITCTLWAETDQIDDQGGMPLDENYSESDFSDEAMAKIKEDCAKFQKDNWDMISDDLDQAGHDFWLTRNDHGAGFWDGDWPKYGDLLTKKCTEFGSLYIYVSDDNKLHLA